MKLLGRPNSIIDEIFSLTKSIWTKMNELFLNIDTIADSPLNGSVYTDNSSSLGGYSEKAKYHDNVRYESPDYWCIRKVRKILKSGTEANEVFYDLGSGKGRVLCVMAQRPFMRVVGVELFENLCEVARQNALHMRWRKAPIEIFCADAAQTDLSDGTDYFMFNPFGVDTMREVITNIKNSLIISPSRITIVYYNAVHEDILKSCEWLQMFYFFHTATGRRVSFWKNFMLITEII
jgi:predicted RNA methylase